MNGEEFTERPSGFMLGKEFIIVVVIIFSGLSFTLGYFVGKSNTPKPVQILQAAESTGQVPKQEPQPAAPSPAAAPLAEPVSPVAHAVTPASKEPVLPVAPAAEKPVQPQKSAESQIAKPAVEKAPHKIEAAALESKSVLYTVQIGAFKNSAEAKHLKTKFDKKGYKSFISAGKNKNGQKIFKVKTGEFSEKKEAELLALKLKKAEGLQTYVTMKTE
ncbi:MAG: SPOR domain-containing protein [Nitrospirae bacterium]|nr:SPOR domain-containing protein [Nitrospirota bacterium]